MRPTQVVDEQATLLDALSHHTSYANFAVGYFASVLRSSTGGKHPDDEYVAAAQAMSHDWVGRSTSALKSAYAYWVKDEMQSLVNWAAQDYDDTVTFDRDVIPTDTGFLVFEHGRRSEDVWGRVSYEHALLWQAGYSRPLQKAGLYVTFFSDLRDQRDMVTQMLNETTKGLRGQEALAFLKSNLQMSHTEFIAWGEEVGPVMLPVPEDYGVKGVGDEDEYARFVKERTGEDYEPTLVPEVANIRRYLLALFDLLGQTVTDVTEEDLPRPHRKRAARMGLPKRVVIIQLRRTENYHRHEGESLVEWQHRWVVRGHWRNQPYGPGRQQTHRIWIAPYVKGPDGKPLIISDKVYAFTR